ncbi:hypothetical protein ASPZODRAFT_126412 [Penicilliopsis zonata CBS 506.65]|uniref:Histone-lysine N-methyltransferase SET9 n=1 Tax=Penicilliopsis zonata CBS 506.65 TaxID=1073090 RepID=A0A1L9STR5_9EURO|nr:hypothetical protein ASPZODRAFT_126412 [Penicilliopsis zonata CBS 506.65]OJJ50526.1 hypothetical protein ASPZODRAFT_126412 [Penicilliopsis zonata CBS 506.65]
MPRSKSSASPAVERRDRLTLAKLASYDDVATDALVDRAYFWTSIRKNRTKYNPARGIHDDDVAQILLHDVIVGKDASKAENRLLAMSGLRKYMARLSGDREKEWFRRHLRKYVQMYLPDCPFEVTTTNRYTITVHEAAICARKFIRQGQEIKYLSGTLVAMTREEELDLGLTRKDFSIVMSSRKKAPSFFLGPARFANHDCHANGRLVTRGSEGMQVVATRDIYIGEEITVSYGDDYFGVDNCECLCLTCERAVRNGWAPDGEVTSPRSDASTPAPNDMPTSNEETPVPESALGPRPSNKRKRGSDGDSEVIVSLTPRKRGKFERQNSKLREEIALPDIAASIEVSTVTAAAASTLIVEAKTNIRLPVMMGDCPLASIAPGNETTGQLLATVDFESTTLLTTEESQRRSGSTTPTSESDSRVSEIKTEQTTEPSVGTGSGIPLHPELPLPSNIDGLSDLSGSCEPDEKFGNGVGRPKKGRRSSRSKALILSVEEDLPRARMPGDYTKTSRLLAHRYDRWVECHTCNVWFVQQDSYLTRRECPRCERHSKLYGYRWPKTDRDGLYDDEERIMDHREVHRFLYPEEEAKISRRHRGIGFGVTPTPELSDAPLTETDVSENGTNRRDTRASRRRTREIRKTM